MSGAEPEHPFAPYVRTLGRGPGRSRALTREEARNALSSVLRGEAAPEQVGAFLMLLRYRGEAADEISGLRRGGAGRVRSAGLAPWIARLVALDWPSYGAGRTRGEPWFLLAALALAASDGVTVLMHGSNEFSQGTAVEAGLETARPARLPHAIGRGGATSSARRRFAYHAARRRSARRSIGY